MVPFIPRKPEKEWQSSIGRMVNYLWGVESFYVNCTVNNVHNILVLVNSQTPHNISQYRTADRSSVVVFLTAFGFLGQKAPSLMTTRGTFSSMRVQYIFLE